MAGSLAEMLKGSRAYGKITVSDMNIGNRKYNINKKEIVINNKVKINLADKI
jgi:hypothetical protein